MLGISSGNQSRVYEASLQYVGAGLSVIPIRADGSKAPASNLLPLIQTSENGDLKRKWTPFQERRPTSQEIYDWFGTSNDEYGIAIIGGAVSGNLEIVDIDNIEFARLWLGLVAEHAPDLLDILLFVATPRPGMHVYYRCTEIEGSQKLAAIPDPEKDGNKQKAMIETKGEGGYCVAPPSPSSCHPTGRPYALIGERDFTQIPTISISDRKLLLDLARSLNRWHGPAPVASGPRSIPGPGGNRPGDDFNAKAAWATVLEPHGWLLVQVDSDGSEKWCRPGKDGGVSAHADFCGTDLLCVFSTNADPLAPGCYTRFQALTLLQFKGNFSAAARHLANLGYGRPLPKRGRATSNPFARYATYRNLLGPRKP